MADYLPLYLPGETITSTASEAVTGGTLAAVSGDDLVGPAGADSAAVVGTFGFNAATGASVTVYGRGTVHMSVASGSITAGARVNAAATGKVKSAAAGTGNVGVAMTTAADGAQVKWMEC